ncbi:MAG TPA: hypothetical protein D7I03_03275 [Candidatus Poseidoniales archaeon]|nr:MAG TPA: hypothetical protein D7I03_03275 [Candidatus Poseidoniales archaeon]HII50341.1 hypothetical protein [Candidatus Poseidoniaceae archaeon]|tara:strand:- start:958 stop:1713 length:756 start_codon:yes stop_codon:yes gene_type:complete
MTTAEADLEKPFLAAILDVFRVKNIDIWKALQYSFSMIMVFAILISLTSTSWFVISNHQDDDWLFGSSNTGFKYGITGFELYTESKEEISVEVTYVIPFSECDGWGSNDFFDGTSDVEDLQCDTMSIGGKIIIFSFLISLVSILGLLFASSYLGLKSPKGDFWTEKYPKYSDIATKVSAILPLIAVLIYAMFAFGFDEELVLSSTALDDSSVGLGMTWWLMFLLSSTYAGLVFRDKIKQLSAKLRSKKNDN